MKTLYILVVLLVACKVQAQISSSIKIGYAVKSVQPIIVPNVEFALHGFSLSPEMIIYYRDNYPADFGLRIAYEYLLRDELSIQAGCGRYFELYSTDAYDKYKNGWANSMFLSIHLRQWVVEYSCLHGSNISAGMRFYF